MSIKQAIEALERLLRLDIFSDPDVALTADEVDAAEAAEDALAALRSMPQGEPVAWQWRKKDQPWSLERTFNSQVFATTDDSEVRPLFATPHTEAVRMSEAEILNILCGVDADTKRLPPGFAQFARAVEQATAARLGVKMGGV